MNDWLAELEGKETEAADAAGEKVDAVASEAAVLGMSCESFCFSFHLAAGREG